MKRNEHESRWFGSEWLVLCTAHRIRLYAWANGKSTSDDSKAILLNNVRHLQHVHVADGVRKHYLVAMQVHPLVVNPVARQRALLAFARVVPFAVLRPTRA